jgi:hypothetical protein
LFVVSALIAERVVSLDLRNLLFFDVVEYDILLFTEHSFFGDHVKFGILRQIDGLRPYSVVE